jgi:regulatory factor X
VVRINQVCDKGKGSVPRGRVYSQYVQRCTTERVTVLNPASFGKLVRVLFPGLKTRRLGVRGESKYHYVNFNLRDDPSTTPSEPQPLIQGAQSFSDQPSFVQSFR